MATSVLKVLFMKRERESEQVREGTRERVK